MTVPWCYRMGRYGELSSYPEGAERVAGVDEVGRGPLAGPVVAAAVVFPPSFSHSHITDSKKLTPPRREELAHEILKHALVWAIAVVGPRRIDEINILEATKQAMTRCLRLVRATRALIDGPLHLPVSCPQEGIIRGDESVLEIGAASIIAKVWRDSLMGILDQRYPQYGFARHSGYPTSYHLEQLRQWGPSPVHRRSFAPVQRCLRERQQ